MKQLIFLVIPVLVIGWVGGWLFNPYQNTDGRLIEAWRQVQPGMEDGEVEVVMGSPMYKFEMGRAWPEWTTVNLPKELALDHRLSAYYIEGWGPQILLVVFDVNDKVSFVGSTHT